MPLTASTEILSGATSGFGEVEAYNSPKLIELNSRKIVVTFSAYHLMGFDASNGKLLWSQEQDSHSS